MPKLPPAPPPAVPGGVPTSQDNNGLAAAPICPLTRLLDASRMTGCPIVPVATSTSGLLPVTRTVPGTETDAPAHHAPRGVAGIVLHRFDVLVLMSPLRVCVPVGVAAKHATTRPVP